MFILIFDFPFWTSIGGISKRYPLLISSVSLKDRQAGLSCYRRQSNPAGADWLTGYLIKVTLPVERVPAPLAWCSVTHSPLLALCSCQHLCFARFLKRPPSNLYMPPLSRLPGSKPFTPNRTSSTMLMNRTTVQIVCEFPDRSLFF